MNNWMNNPFAYLMFMPFMASFANGGWGNNRGVGQGFADVGLSNQIQNLSNQVADNQNANQTNAAISAVSGSVKDNGVAMNAGFDTLASSLCGVKTSILEQGAAINLGNCQQSNLILQQAQATNNIIQNGFTQIGFQLERNACDVKETSTANTQRIIDTLGNHWQAEAQSMISQLRNELNLEKQTNHSDQQASAILAAINALVNSNAAAAAAAKAAA